VQKQFKRQATLYISGILIASLFGGAALSLQASAKPSPKPKSHETSQEMTTRLMQQMHLRYTARNDMPKPLAPGDRILKDTTPSINVPSYVYKRWNRPPVILRSPAASRGTLGPNAFVTGDDLGGQAMIRLRQMNTFYGASADVVSNCGETRQRCNSC